MYSAWSGTAEKEREGNGMLEKVVCMHEMNRQRGQGDGGRESRREGKREGG